MKSTSRVKVSLAMVLLALVATVTLTVSHPAPLAAAETLTGPELLRALQQGGFVIYFRHTGTDHEQKDITPIDFNRCAAQRNLSEAGRRQARDIGEVFAALRIRFGQVLTSPYCRCVDTAQLAFGFYEKV